MPSKKPKTPKTQQSPIQVVTTTPPSAHTSATTNHNDFAPFADLVATNFQRIASSDKVFVADTDPDTLYALYLASFPEGSNPLVKSRTEHDCSACKQFIRRVGNVVTVDGGKVKTVWDDAAARAQYPYDVVAKAMQIAVAAHPLSDIFRISEKEGSFGARQTRNLDAATGQVCTHHHFYTGDIPRRLRPAAPDTERGEYRTTIQVFERGLVELSGDAIDTVLGLIEANNLYRGEEHKRAVVEFQTAQTKYKALPLSHRRLYVWCNAAGPAARFRNSVIGTLVQELSEGKDVDAAVRSFEAKVAPQNYKRTSAVITPTMVKKAMETIASLGLESALERRFAVMSDISVGDVLWVDGAAKQLMRGGIADALMQHAVAATPPRRAEDEEKHAEVVSIDDFVKTVLPTATSMEVLLKSEHLGNLMSLTAPVHPEPKQLFRWTNDFAWSYCGNVADSIKERVKKAGGKVEGVTLRVSLSWFNYDDLDLHIVQPANSGGYRSIIGDEIFYGSKRGWTGGVLDVDMNAGGGQSRTPVENTVWTQKMPDGAYKIVVNNFSQREMSDVGFVVEVESAGKIQHYSYNRAVNGRSNVHVATLHMRGGLIERVEAGDPAVTAANISQEKWGLRSEQYVKVNAVTLSPNYWGSNAVGNKHTFFVLDGAKCDEAIRGIYNEFLHPRLEQHRKVFEIIGDKTKCQPIDGALSGLGFSSTKHDSVIVRCTMGKKRRLYNVNF